MKLTDHFTLEDMIHSDVAKRRGFINSPNSKELDNLENLCEEILEPVRKLLGVPLHIKSGYRSELVNSTVGGAYNSAHMDGRAADFVPQGKSLSESFELIKKSDIPFDQLILECDAWIHVSCAAKPRKEALKATGHPGAWKYERVS